MRNVLGIDNGVSGSWAVVGRSTWFGITPTMEQLGYQKKAKFLKRIDWKECIKQWENLEIDMVYLERPMVNPTRFEASMSAIRAFEATLIVFEHLGLGHQVLDSKAWQKELLPEGLKGADLKKASMQKAIQLYPHYETQIRKHKDGDAFLIAHYGLNKLS